MMANGKLENLFPFFRKVIVFFLLLKSFCSFGQVSVGYLPQSSAFSQSVNTFNFTQSPQNYRLAAVSLQGLVNRDTACIYLIEERSRWILEHYKERKIVRVDHYYESVYSLLSDFREYYNGFVVYDPEKRFTINLASNIAGVESRVIISPDMIKRIKKISDADVDILDLRDLNLYDDLEAYLWYERNILPYQTNSILAEAKDHEMHDIYRDYLIQFKVPTFWLPGPEDNNYNKIYEDKIIELFKSTPANIPVLGFWPSFNNAGEMVGYPEFKGVKMAGTYGKYTLVNDWVGNYSFHSAINREQLCYKQNMVREKQFQKYDPTKKYVALIMIESGDSPGYFQSNFAKRQWNDPFRGKVPLSYGISPSLRLLMPEITRYFYETATENDFFFCSISGVGYCYPFEGYADSTEHPEKNLKEYFSLTANNMRLMDLDMLGIYTHPDKNDGKWSAKDREIAKKFIVPMKGVNSIISGMHRTGYIASNANEMIDSISVHHTLTFWPLEKKFQWNDTELDSLAVDFMVKEIKKYGKGGNFIQAMFYSWMYGPRRLYKLQKRLVKEGYEFVTLNEFDYLFRIQNSFID